MPIDLSGSDLVVEAQVKAWYSMKGYGFAQTYESGEDIFIHYTMIQAEAKRRDLGEGEVVRVLLDEKFTEGLRAKKVWKIPVKRFPPLYARRPESVILAFR